MTRSGERLQVQGMRKTFGGLTAVDDVSFTAEPGQVTSLIGPNGAGKSTLFGCLTGSLRPDRGSVRLGTRELTGLPADVRARAGMGRTFQRLELFTSLTVADNLQVALDAGRTSGLLRGLFTLRHPEPAGDARRVADVLRFLELDELADTPAGALPTGLGRLVELGRALCTDPSVVLLDEPASGLDSGETERLQQVLATLAGDGMTVVLVEHDVELVMSLSARVNVLDFGRLIASGTPAEITANSDVRAAYLGAA